MKAYRNSPTGRSLFLLITAAVFLCGPTAVIGQTSTQRERNPTLYAEILENGDVKLTLKNRGMEPEILPAPRAPAACHFACTIRTQNGKLVEKMEFAPPPKARPETKAKWITLKGRESLEKTISLKDFGFKPLPMGRYAITFYYRPSPEKNNPNMDFSSGPTNVRVRYDNPFMKANPDFFTRVTQFYQMTYLYSTAKKLSKAAELTEDQMDIAEKAISDFINRWVKYQCQYNGTMDWQGLDAAMNPLDKKLKAALSDKQFKQYLQWRTEGKNNPLDFLFRPNFRNTAVAPAKLILVNVKHAMENHHDKPQKTPPKPPLEWQVAIVRPDLHPFESIPIHLRILQNINLKAQLAGKPEGELQVRLTPKGKKPIVKSLKLSDKPTTAALQYLTGFTSPVFYSIDLDLRSLFKDLPTGKYCAEFTFPPQIFLGLKDRAISLPSKPMVSPPLFFQVHDITRKALFEDADAQKNKNPDGMSLEINPPEPDSPKTLPRTATVRNNSNHPISFQIFGKSKKEPKAGDSLPSRALSQHEVFTGKKTWKAQPAGYVMKKVFRQTLQPGQSIDVILSTPRYKGLYRYWLPITWHLPDAPAKEIKLYSQPVFQTTLSP